MRAIDGFDFGKSVKEQIERRVSNLEAAHHQLLICLSPYLVGHPQKPTVPMQMFRFRVWAQTTLAWVGAGFVLGYLVATLVR